MLSIYLYDSLFEFCTIKTARKEKSSIEDKKYFRKFLLKIALNKNMPKINIIETLSPVIIIAVSKADK